jgi:hypothetical protein
MPSWWDSLEAVSKFNSLMSWTAGVLGVLAAICGVLIIISGNRKDELKDLRDAQVKEQADKREEELRTRVVAAEEAKRPRELTPEQKNKLLVMLKESPKGHVDLRAPLSDDEAAMFALKLRAVLVEAGWETSNSAIRTANIGARGLYVEIFGTTISPPHADALLKALNAIGLHTTKRIIARDTKGRIGILVGSKP